MVELGLPVCWTPNKARVARGSAHALSPAREHSRDGLGSCVVTHVTETSRRVTEPVTVRARVTSEPSACEDQVVSGADTTLSMCVATVAAVPQAVSRAVPLAASSGLRRCLR